MQYQRYGNRMDRGNREKEPSASVMLRGLKPTTTAEMVCFFLNLYLNCKDNFTPHLFIFFLNRLQIV